MPEQKHTPGPWKAVDHPHYPGMMVVEGPEMPITVITSAIGVDLDSHIRRVANAHLIAAAPDLLGIARRWAALDGQWHPDHYESEKAELLIDTNAVIAKATQ